jgi:hypothetical protein
MIGQLREINQRVRRDGGTVTDTMTQVQIDRTADLTTAELVAECRRLVPRAAAGRRKTPAPLRRLVSFRVEMGPIDERWRLGYLVDVILTRDAWLHRIDLCRALGVDPALTAEHDGVLIADIVREWAQRHGQPYHLELTGPAGGTFTGPGHDGAVAVTEPLVLDPVEMCRILSGRAEGTGLLTTPVPF